jgi:glutamate/tyrosine decarboxylase-like PLP-dependent enzyme
MRRLLTQATEYSIRYLEGLNQRPVFPTPEAIARLNQLNQPLPHEPTDPEHVLALLSEIGSAATVACAGPRYFGFVTGGVLPAPLAANWLAAAWDQNAGLFFSSPLAAKIEEVARSWLLDVLSLPDECGIGFVTGATMANFTALAAARHSVLKEVGWDAEARGLFEAPLITVIVGEEVHVSVLKALSMLGLGRERVVRVPADGQGRLRPEALPAISGPTIVCIQAGNVNTGAFDPASEIIPRVKADGAWVHVDGAFGLWAAAAPNRTYLAKGYDQADSWATDAHKWLNVPYDSGIIFCQNPKNLQAAMSASAAYLMQTENREPSQFVPEFSRRARGIEVWAALQSLGRSGLAEMIERTCHHAARFADGLRTAGYQVLNDVVLNQVLVSFGDPERTQRVIAEIQEDGTCWCGGTEWQGHTAMRISVSSWATTEEDVDRSLEAIVRIADQV